MKGYPQKKQMLRLNSVSCESWWVLMSNGWPFPEQRIATRRGLKLNPVTYFSNHHFPRVSFSIYTENSGFQPQSSGVVGLGNFPVFHAKMAAWVVALNDVSSYFYPHSFFGKPSNLFGLASNFSNGWFNSTTNYTPEIQHRYQKWPYFKGGPGSYLFQPAHHFGAIQPVSFFHLFRPGCFQK